MWRLPARFCRPLLPQIWTRHALLRMCSLLVSINAHWSAGLRPYPLDQARGAPLGLHDPASASNLSRKPAIVVCLPLRLVISTLKRCPFLGKIRYAILTMQPIMTRTPTLHGRSRFVIAANGRATIPVPNPSLQPITINVTGLEKTVPLNAEGLTQALCGILLAMLPAIPSIETSHQIRVRIAGDDRLKQRYNDQQRIGSLSRCGLSRESTPFTGWWSRRPSRPNDRRPSPTPELQKCADDRTAAARAGAPRAAVECPPPDSEGLPGRRGWVMRRMLSIEDGKQNLKGQETSSISGTLG